MVTRRGHETVPEIPPPARIGRIDLDGSVLLYISPLVGVRPDGRVAGDDVASQFQQVNANTDACLASQGAGREHIVRVTGYARAGVDLSPMWELDPTPRDVLPVGTFVVVPSLADPAWLYQQAVVAVVDHP